MHHGESSAPAGHCEGAHEERGLNTVNFIGSYPAADFAVPRPHPEVALLGRSNVGKSSLLNRLIGRRSLARTSRTPGKTRACNVYEIGGQLLLVDLPGYGYARASKAERRGFSRLIRSYLSERRRLVGVIWLLDIRHDPSTDDLEIGNLLTERGVPVLVAVTKGDKLSRSHRKRRLVAIADAVGVNVDQCVVTSAKTQEGVAELRASLDSLLADQGIEEVDQ